MAVNLAAVKARQSGPPPKPPVEGKLTKAQKREAEVKAQTAKALADLKVVPEWSTLPELKQFRYKPENGKAMTFSDLCDKLTNLQAEINFRELQKKELQKELELALASAGVEKVEWEDRPVMIVYSHGASTVDPHKLLEQGVSPDQIAAATVPGREFSYPLIGKPPKTKK